MGLCRFSVSGVWLPICRPVIDTLLQAIQSNNTTGLLLSPSRPNSPIFRPNSLSQLPINSVLRVPNTGWCARCLNAVTVLRMKVWTNIQLNTGHLVREHLASPTTLSSQLNFIWCLVAETIQRSWRDFVSRFGLSPLHWDCGRWRPILIAVVKARVYWLLSDRGYLEPTQLPAATTPH